MTDKDRIALTVEVVASFVANNPLAPDQVPGFIASTHAAIAAIGSDEPAPGMAVRRPVDPRPPRAVRA